MPISFASLSGGGASKIQKTEKITSTQSWTVPADVEQVEVILCGGGGSGAIVTSAGAGGGGGSADYALLSVTPGESFTITIGAGGAGTKGYANAYGNNGTSSSFGSYFSVEPGIGGGRENYSPYNENWQLYGGKGGGKGSRGGVGMDSTTDVTMDAGVGFMGYGAGGGWGGKQVWQSGAASNGAGAGGNYQIIAENAKANTGGGGGGHSCSGLSPVGNGDGGAGNGGSGVCIIKYWTAE